MTTILEDYKKNEKNFLNAKNQYVLLIESLLTTKNIVFHSVNGRVKNEASLEGKIIKKSNKYNNIDEITDIIGLRIITYTQQVIDHVKELLCEEFEVTEIIEKREEEVNKFGYKSLHIIIKLKSPRNELLEFSEIKDLKIEVQIRTILQHAWAEVEHDIGYKGTDKLPYNITRSFARIASLLELADIEFVKILDAASKHEEYDNSNKNKHQKLDVIILENIIFTNDIIKKLDQEINQLLRNDKDNWDIINLNESIERLADVGIETKEELINAINENQTEFIGYLNNFIKQFGVDDLISKKYSFFGITIFYLIYLLLAKNYDEQQIEKHLTDFGFNIKEISGKLVKDFYNK